MRKFITGTAVFSLASCTAIPEFTPDDYIQISELLIKAECELKEAVNSFTGQERDLAQNQLVSAIYQLKVVESGTGSGTLAFVAPISNGTFTLGFEASVNKSVTRDTSITVEYETNKLDCLRDALPEDAPEVLAGDIGLKDWIINTAAALRAAKETPTVMSYKIDFDIVRSGAINPKFSVAFPSGRARSGSAKIAGSHQTLHSITVSVAEIKGNDKAGARKIINQEIQQFRLLGMQ